MSAQFRPIGGGSDTPYETLVYQPGGTAIANIYITWASLYAAATALGSVPKRIIFDSTFATCNVPMGNYAFLGSNNIFSAMSGDALPPDGLVAIDFNTNVLISGIYWFDGPGDFHSTSTIGPPFQFFNEGLRVVNLTNGAQIRGTGGHAVIGSTGTGVIINMYERTKLTGQAVTMSDGISNLNIVMGAGAQIDNGAVQAIAPNLVTVDIRSSGAVLADNQPLPATSWVKNLHFAQMYTFVLPGDLTAGPFVTQGQFIANRVGSLQRAHIIQRQDSTGAGASGSTNVTVYRRTGPGTRIAIASGFIAQGAGNNAGTTLGMIGTEPDRTFAMNDIVEAEMTSAMAAGGTTPPAGLTISVFIAPLA